MSLEFLAKGFEAYGKRIPADEIEEAVNRLDGIVGWLVLYGHESLSGHANIQSIINQAVKMVGAEDSKIIAKSKHYRFILKALSAGERKWKNIYDFVELNEGHVSESVFNDSLTYLRKYGMVIKNAQDETYYIPDPITIEYARKL